MTMRSLVTGATGFVGSRLMQRLERPVVLSRSAPKAKAKLSERLFDAYDWDAEHALPPLAAFKNVETIFHLAGEPVSEGRWTDAKKVALRESRVAGTRHLVEALGQLPAERRPKTLVSASAVGYYGSRGDEVLTEVAEPQDSYLAEICVAWENEAWRASELGMRVVMIRVGIVLGPGGGALAKMLPPFKLWVGSPLGNGRQWMPWIHLDDLVEMFLFAAETDTFYGPANGSAPNPVTNREFTHTLGKVLGVPTILPAVPGFALRAVLGEFGDMLLTSQRALPQAAEQAGFKFQYPTLEEALVDIVE